MYASRFGLRQRPFRTTPDLAAYYPATTHERALARLLQGLKDQEGLLLLTGEPGLGKTLLCHVLLERLGPDLVSAFLTNSHLQNRLGLLQAILYEFSLPYEGRTEQDARLAVTDFLLKNYAGEKRALLLVDEAQYLSPDLLEELRMLGNLEGREGKALQVLLIAQPEIADTLERPELTVFRQRLAVRVQLHPLPKEEAADYLNHQLRAVGGRPEKLIAEEALDILTSGTHGVPRSLNQAAHQAFLLAHEADANQVDVEAALEALAVLGLSALEAGELGTEPPEPAEVGQDAGPLLSLTDGVLAANDVCDPGDAVDYQRLMQPKRPA
jgi:type II secretory pathway predicted ATPase ExeA